MLIEVSLPAAEAPVGVLNTGDRIALFGAETTGSEALQPTVGLIGVLTLEFVQDDRVTHVVTSGEAKGIQDLVDRYNSSTDRSIWKLGTELSSSQLVDLYDAAGGAPGGDNEFDPPAPSGENSTEVVP